MLNVCRLRRHPGAARGLGKLLLLRPVVEAADVDNVASKLARLVKGRGSLASGVCRSTVILKMQSGAVVTGTTDASEKRVTVTAAGSILRWNSLQYWGTYCMQ